MKRTMRSIGIATLICAALPACRQQTDIASSGAIQERVRELVVLGRCAWIETTTNGVQQMRVHAGCVPDVSTNAVAVKLPDLSTLPCGKEPCTKSQIQAAYKLGVEIQQAAFEAMLRRESLAVVVGE